MRAWLFLTTVLAACGNTPAECVLPVVPADAPEVRVMYAPELPDAAARSTGAAMQWWNSLAGRELFVRDDTVRNGDCNWAWVGPGDLRGEYAETTTEPCKAFVLISADVPSELRVAVTAHELGHVLGLGHSDNPFNVMFANPSTTQLCE